MKLFHSQAVPLEVTSSSSAAGYPASAVSVSQVGRPWRSVGTGLATLTVDLGAATSTVALLVQGANWERATVHHSQNRVLWAEGGDLLTNAQGDGRRKGLLVFAAGDQYRRLTIPSGVPTDGAGYWEIGALYLWRASSPLPTPKWGFRLRYEWPQVEQLLPNGRRVVSSAGPSRAVISAEWDKAPGDDPLALARAARSSVVCLDLGLSTHPGLVWPVRCLVGGADHAISQWGVDTVSLEAVEEV